MIENKIMTAKKLITFLERITGTASISYFSALCWWISLGDRKHWGKEAEKNNEVWNCLYYASIAMPKNELVQLPGEIRVAIETIQNPPKTNSEVPRSPAKEEGVRL